jgi:hypothetical protein
MVPSCLGMKMLVRVHIEDGSQRGRLRGLLLVAGSTPAP